MTYWLYISAAAIAIAGTYILWGPSNRPKQKKKNAVPGLLNLGNSCFLNAVLQALASCSSCASWLMKAVEYADEQQNKNSLLIKSVLTVLSALNGSDDNCSGAEVIKALRAHRWIIPHEEHDAHELFHVLTTTVEEELVALNPVTSLLDTKKIEDNADQAAEPKKAFVSTPKTLPVKLAFPMRGLLVNELKCNACNFKHPARYDSFDSITLTIPSPNNGKLTLHDLLLKFIACELIQDVVCETCPKNDPTSESADQPIKTTFTQQVSFGKLPECLCVHIQRTVWLKNGLSVKCHDKISFPEVLIMDYFVHTHSQKEKQLGASYSRLRLTGGNSSKTNQNAVNACPLPSEKNAKLSTDLSESIKNVLPLNLSNKEIMSSYKYMYLLKAVIVHLGGVSSGHFITYRRVGSSKQNEKWFYTSDLEVKEVPFSEVSSACAYMLFYEKIR